MLDLGVVRPGSTIRLPFNTFDSNDPSASVTATGLAVADIGVYKDGNTTQRASTAGFAVAADFDSLVGIHHVEIDLSDNTTAGFYEAGSEYIVTVGDITVDAATVRFALARFIIGYPDAILNTTIATLASQTSFTLEEGPADNDALNGFSVIVHDLASDVQFCHAVVSDYVGSTRTVTLAVDPGIFTMAAGDNISFFVPALQPTTAGRTLDVTATGAAGIDWGNVENPATAVDLSGTDIQLADTTTNVTNGVSLANGAITNASLAGNMEVVFETDFATNYNTTRNAWATNVQDTVGTGTLGLNDLSAAEVKTQVDTGLTDIHLDHAFAVDYNPASKPGVATALFNELIESDAGVSRFTVNALENAPSGSGASAAAIADAVWDEAQADHTSAGSFGETATEIASILDDTGTSGVAIAGTPSVNVTQISGDATAADNLEADYDGTGYNKSNSTIGTTTTNTDMRGTDGANTTTPPTAAAIVNEWESQSQADPTGFQVNVREVNGTSQTAGDIPAQITALNDISVADILTTQMTESYAADGVAPTIAQALFLIQQELGDFAISGTTLTVREIDGITTAATFTLDDATNPTSKTRAT